MWRIKNEEEIPVDDFQISSSTQSILAENGVLRLISAVFEDIAKIAKVSRAF